SNSSQQQTLVGLFLERGIDLIAAMLASLKIGVAYVPLDPAYPAQRTHQIIQSAQLCLVVSTRQLSDKLEVRDIPVVDTQVACGLDGRRIDMIVTAQHLAYVIFTSGSTGEPKGVCISHENLMYSTMARTVQYVSAHNRFLLLSSVAFDSSVAGIFGTLCSGGTLIIPQPGHERELNIICELIHTHCVSRTLMLPSLYRLLLQHGDAQQLNSLEVVIVAGEPCPPALVALHFELNQSACLFNEYGPTETCVWSTVHECAQSDQKVVPIGRPIAESQCFVLNERCQPCPPGIIGELYLAGRGVCAGYLGSSDDVGDPFLKPGSLWQGSPRMYRSGDLVYWSPAQELVYVGRKDRQVKIRGHRVEPAEIESIISRSENVNDVAVVIRSKAFDVEKESGIETQTRNHQILVYYIPSTVEIKHDDSSDSLAPTVVSDELNRVSLIEMAGQSLPSYMRPSAWIALDRMPRLPNGKVDLKNLPDPVWTPNQTTQITTKADPRIEHLCQILAELLGHEEVHASDNFFDLGGDSIIAIQFVSKARNAGYDLTVASVIVSGAIADMNNLPANAVSHQGHIQATGKTRLSPIQNWFFSQRHPQPQHWNLAGVVAFNKRLDTDLLEQSIRVCVARFPELGASFHVQGVQGYAYIPNATPPIDLVLRGAATDSVDDERGLEFWESIVNPVQMGFELETGWLLRFIMLPAAHSHMGGLIWVAHHLVVDPVSMDLILGSIESEYCTAINDGRQRSNTAHGAECASVGYRHWAEVLADQADQLHNDRRVSNDAAENAFRGPPSNIFAGISAARSTEADKKIQQLDTNCLSVSDIESINQTFGTRTQELLVLVLMETMCELQQLKSIRFDIETHGRDLMSEHLVADQSVGWFSNLIAVALTPSESPEWRHRIKTFKEFFRRATDRHAFDLLEHYRGIRDDCDTPLQAVLFNYHGRRRVDLSPERLWRHEIKTWPFLRAQQNHCSYIIEVNVWHTENHLRWHWQYVQSCMDDERFHALCTLLESRFRSLGSILSEGTSREFTPSDFPDLDIDQAQLDEFLDSLE
nr:amino acid adenylation domain-containing protein [Granulosicoccus sp.]